MNEYQEINFDGLVGPTHHYGGLSVDNLASDSNRNTVSNPRQAALQGLEKMKALADMGFPQAVLPPLMRPGIPALRSLGIFGDTPADVLLNAYATDPHLLSSVASASSMWTANAATVAPSIDTLDKHLHLVTANLNSKLHRALEAPATYRNLQEIFGTSATHAALPGGHAMGDEGAANHTRLAASHGTRGIHVFVYGRKGKTDALSGEHFLGRQTLEASMAVARLLKLSGEQVVLVQQNQEVINQGVFHNDVIAVGNLDCYFSHEKAYTEGAAALQAISQAFARITGKTLHHVVVPEEQISVAKAIRTYLFNSQLIGPPGEMTLIAPQECKEDAEVFQYLESLCKDASSPIRQVRYFDLRESMRNGGGPACLRLRVVLNRDEIASLGARVLLDDSLFEDLTAWVSRHYRDRLSLQDLATAELYQEVTRAFEELRHLLRLQS